jgi:hypothetical protein
MDISSVIDIPKKKLKTKDTRSNSNEFSIEMQHLINETAKAKGLVGEDIGGLTHAIIKNENIDIQLQALTIARRLLYCCPKECVDNE